jgi:hypothetical protein
MRTVRITVNKTPQQPQGIELDLIEPEGTLESGVLAHLLGGYLQHASKTGQFALELPPRFTIEHKGQGSFVLFSAPEATRTADPQTGYYSPAKALAVVGLRSVGRQFELVYRDLRQAAPASPGAEAPASPEAPAPPATPPAPGSNP